MLTYDAAGRVWRSSGPAADGQGNLICTQEIRYDDAGRQVEVISLPDGGSLSGITETHYDGPRQDWTQDARGYRTSFEYDDLGRVVKTIHPATAVEGVGTVFTYTHVGYGSFGRKAWETPGPVSIASNVPDNQRKWYSYDVAGRLTKVKMPAVDDTTGTCPVYRYFYDAYGNQVAIVDPLGRVTRFVYNELNLLTQKYQPFAPSPALSDTATTADVVGISLSGKPYEAKTYDSHNRILVEIDCDGHSTVYRYYKNEVGSVDHFMSGTTFLGIPGQLRIEEHYTGVPDESPDSSIAYIYDRLGRKTKETVTPGTSLEYGTWYDNEGRITAVSSPEGTVHYEYDSRTGLKTSTWTGTTITTATTKTDYTYDNLGRLSTVQVTRRNGVAVSDRPTIYSYNKNGSQEKVVYPNGDNDNITNRNEAVYEYDALNRLVRLTNYKDSDHVETDLLSRFEYSCYANGQRATAVETRQGWIDTSNGRQQNGHPTRQIAYQYDGLGRLKREQRNGNDPNLFTYDIVGNRVSQEVGNLVGSGDNVKTYYFYDARDRLEKESLYESGTPAKITYGYDDNGSLTSQTTFGSNGLMAETVAYVYNLQGRLKQVTTTPYTNGTPGTAVVTQYGYDPSGNRIRKQVGAGTPTVYLVDPLNPTGYSQVLQETTGSTVTAYILGADVIGQAAGSADPEYLLYDGHGSVRNHADGDGELIWFDIPGYAYHTDHPTEDYTQFSYDAWGQECRRPTGDGLFYSGEQYDQTLKMYNLRARYYNPANGRFNQTDPYAGSSYDPLSLHTYLYCHADPVNGIDPSGEMSMGEVITVTTIIGFFNFLTPALNQNMKEKQEAILLNDSSSAITCLDKGVQTQRQRDLLGTSDPDFLNMTEEFYHDLGQSQKQITYYNNRMSLTALQGIDATIHAAQVGGAILGVVGGVKGAASQVEVFWPDAFPHPAPDGWEHWSTLRWNAIWRSMNKGDIEKIYVNHALSTSTNRLTGSLLRPDWIEKTTQGTYRIYEIQSPYQTYDLLLRKGWIYKSILGNRLECYDILQIGQQIP
jgi:RHS repeat-associated protein